MIPVLGGRESSRKEKNAWLERSLVTRRYCAYVTAQELDRYRRCFARRRQKRSMQSSIHTSPAKLNPTTSAPGVVRLDQARLNEQATTKAKAKQQTTITIPAHNIADNTVLLTAPEPSTPRPKKHSHTYTILTYSMSNRQSRSPVLQVHTCPALSPLSSSHLSSLT